MKKTYLIPHTIVVDRVIKSNILAGSLPADIVPPGIGGSSAKQMNIIEVEHDPDNVAEDNF